MSKIRDRLIQKLIEKNRKLLKELSEVDFILASKSDLIEISRQLSERKDSSLLRDEKVLDSIVSSVSESSKSEKDEKKIALKLFEKIVKKKAFCRKE